MNVMKYVVKVNALVLSYQFVNKRSGVYLSGQKDFERQLPCP
jgi:hypothetical protein